MLGALKSMNNEIFMLEKEENTIGRGNNCDIVLQVS